MLDPLSAHAESLTEAICDELGAPISDETRGLVALFVDSLSASLALGVPHALGEQLRWQSRRLALVAPHLDADRLVQATTTVLHDLDGEVAQAALQHLATALNDLAHERSAPPEPDAAFGALSARYLELALAGEHDRAVDLIVRCGLSPRRVLLDVLEPAQRELGRRWEEDRVSVEEEHDTTALTRRIMSLLRWDRSPVPTHGRVVFAGLVGDEQHSVGLEMVADLLSQHGWTVTRHDGPVSHRTVADAVAAVQPDVVALSVSLLKHVVEVRSVIEELRTDERTRHLPVVVGGRPFRGNPALSVLVGADAWAPDGRDAVVAVERVGRSATRSRHVASDLEGPIETILALSALIQDDAASTRRQRDLAGRVVRAARGLLARVEDLDRGTESFPGLPAAEPGGALVDIDDLVAAVLARYQSRVSGQDIVLRQIRIPPDRGRALIHGDAAQLERVVDTLVANAVSVTPTAGIITVRVRRGGGLVSVAVADEGPSVPRESREDVFDPARALTSMGATDLGPWRGLATSRRIAEQHQGSLSVTSDHRGSVFTLVLPLSEGTEERAAPGPPSLSVVRDDGA